MDTRKLQQLLFEETGQRIDCNDPVFAVVALNQLVLSEKATELVGELESASGKVNMQIGQLLAASKELNAAHNELEAKLSAAIKQSRAEAIAQVNASAASAVERVTADVYQSAHRAAAAAAANAVGEQMQQLLAGLEQARQNLTSAATAATGKQTRGAFIAFFAAVAGVLLAPVAQNGIAAAVEFATGQKMQSEAIPALTAEQSRLIAQAEKLQQALPRLDQKTRVKLLTEMDNLPKK